MFALLEGFVKTVWTYLRMNIIWKVNYVYFVDNNT